jgi:hypothetical protein
MVLATQKMSGGATTKGTRTAEAAARR